MACPVPDHILIVGAGVFGLSTALSLCKRKAYARSRITIIDASPTLPNPSGSSVDSSRIIRADYACKPYAALASEAQLLWRDQSDDGWGGRGRYHESGFVLTADRGMSDYLEEALSNVRSLADDGVHALDPSKIEKLDNKAAIQKATGFEGVSGDQGYANWNSGWADAEACVRYALNKVQSCGDSRITLKSGANVRNLMYGKDGTGASRCTGVELEDGSQILADLTVLAAGAWTPALIDLHDRCLATGQVLAYMNISAEEQAEFEKRPVIMNMSRGMYLIPPRRQELKIARHGFGYRNLQKIHHHKSGRDVSEISIPKVGISIPSEGEEACRAGLIELLPQLADRPFARTRICWYSDTPDGDFLIDYVPQQQGLFVATGGSGHGFKFFPVIGDKIVDAIEDKLDPDLKKMWRWKDRVSQGFLGTEDGSRSGRKGMVLDEELARC